jgi:hypothetical protein
VPSRTLSEMATIFEITTSSLEIKAERDALLKVVMRFSA